MGQIIKKMKKSELIKLLLGIGVTQANADKIAANTPDEGTSIDQTEIDTIVSDFKANQLALHENEPAIIKKIEVATAARERDTFQRKLRQTFGLEIDAFKDKNVEESIKITHEKVSANSNKTVEQLQNELIEKVNRIKELQDTEIPLIRGEVEKHKKQFNVNDKLTKLVSSFSLRNPLEDVMASVQAHLGNAYDVDIDDKGEIIVKVKGSDLQPKNADGTKLLTAKEIVQAKLEAGQFLKQSNADEEAAKAAELLRVRNLSAPDKDTDLTKFPGYEKAKANLESLKIKP